MRGINYSLTTMPANLLLKTSPSQTYLSEVQESHHLSSRQHLREKYLEIPDTEDKSWSVMRCNTNLKTKTDQVLD